nr:hypothetical protein [Tanacetum cinerariifolium]
DAYEKKLIQVLKIHTDDDVADLLTKAFDASSKELASPKQTALGKDNLNPLIVNSLLKTRWLSMHHVIAMKHWLFQSKQLLYQFDEKDGIRVTAGDLKLLLLSILLLLFWATVSIKKANERTAWNEFSCSMASAVICLATEEEDEVEVPAAPTPPSPTIEPSPPLQDPITTPQQAQPAKPSSPPQEQPTTTSESLMTLLNTLMETCATLSQKVAAFEQDKIAQALEIFKLKKRVKKLVKKRRSKFSSLKRLRKVGGRIEAIDADEEITLVDMETPADLGAEFQRRKNDDNAAIKDASAAEPTVFDDEEVTMTMAQTLIKTTAEKARLLDEKYQCLKRKPISIAQARKNMIVYLKNMARYKMEHFKGMNFDKKRVAEETLLQESFKKLKAVKVSGSHSIQDTPTDDPKEINEEDVKNMLEIVPRSSDEDFHRGQQTKEQKFRYILYVIKKLELKKLNDLLAGVDAVQRLEEKALRD